jgi:hypothetical protein
MAKTGNNVFDKGKKVDFGLNRFILQPTPETHDLTLNLPCGRDVVRYRRQVRAATSENPAH